MDARRVCAQLGIPFFVWGFSGRFKGDVVDEFIAAGFNYFDTAHGYLNGRPIWEVKSGKSYYIVDFEKRKLLSKEGL